MLQSLLGNLPSQFGVFGGMKECDGFTLVDVVSQFSSGERYCKRDSNGIGGEAGEQCN